MNLKTEFLKLKTKVTKKPVWQGNSDYAIVPAFISGGVQYYEIPGVFNIPYQRGLAAGSIYEEVNMRVTKEYLQGHIAAVLEILSNPQKINILELSKLYDELDKRINWIASPETIYKLASVVYFDENESPEEYNFKYANEKILRWKKEGVEAFFLREPIRKFLPHSDLQEKDIPSYIQTAMKVEAKQSESLLHRLFRTHSTKEFYTILKSQAEASKNITL